MKKVWIILAVLLAALAAIAFAQISVTRTLKGPVVQLDAALVGARGTTIWNIQYGTVSIDPPSIATVTRGTATFTVQGAAVGDACVMLPPATFNDDLLYVGCDASATDTLRVFIYNPTGGAIDDTAKTWGFVWFDTT